MKGLSNMNSHIVRRLRSQTQCASGMQPPPPKPPRGGDVIQVHFQRHEVAYEAPRFEDIGKIEFLGTAKEAAALIFYKHGFKEVVDPVLYKLREDKARRTAQTISPKVYIKHYYYDIIEVPSQKVRGEFVTRRFVHVHSHGDDDWAAESYTFDGKQVRLLPQGAL